MWGSTGPHLVKFVGAFPSWDLGDISEEHTVDYQGLGRLEAKDPTSCGRCVLESSSLTTREFDCAIVYV
jgi:hypothetical protein